MTICTHDAGMVPNDKAGTWECELGCGHSTECKSGCSHSLPTAPCGHRPFAADHCGEMTCDNYYMKCILWGTPLAEHLQGHKKGADDQPVLVCVGCGEVFDSITAAYEHGVYIPGPDPSWCGEEGFNIGPREMVM